MKKINSIGYGGKILGLAALFALIVPGVISLINFRGKNEVLAVIARASFVIGIIIGVFLALLLAVELRQDKNRIKYYKAHGNTRLVLKNGAFECQSCGSRLVKPGDKRCGFCGAVFKD